MAPPPRSRRCATASALGVNAATWIGGGGIGSGLTKGVVSGLGSSCLGSMAGGVVLVSATGAAAAVDIPPNPERPTPVAAAISPKSLLVSPEGVRAAACFDDVTRFLPTGERPGERQLNGGSPRDLIWLV